MAENRTEQEQNTLSQENGKFGVSMSPAMERAMTAMGFTELTEVQLKTIPEMRSGADLVVKAPTGTGKTFAFGIPIIEQIDPEKAELQALILAPTRELAAQIHAELCRLTAYTSDIRIAVLYGGQPIGAQITLLKKRPQIIVATPGRLLDHMSRRTVKPHSVRIAVLDEADEMLDMGFFKDVSNILDKLPKDKQLAMFSATITREVMDIMWLYQRDAVEITVERAKDNEPKIRQYALRLARSDKTPMLFRLLNRFDYKRVMVFCNTKRMTERLVGDLRRQGFDADGLSSDISQSIRTKIMERFKKHQLRILVATDVAARGIDVDDVDAVFNYEIPDENESYVHRIGRTGRAKKQGVAISFVYDYPSKLRLDEIAKLTKNQITAVRMGEDGQFVPVE